MTARAACLGRTASIALVAAAALALAAGCGGGGGGGAGERSGASAPLPGPMDVGPAGRALTLSAGAASGSTLEVPAGALAGTVTLDAAEGAPVARAGSIAVGPALRLGPAGTTFAAPARVGVRFLGASLPAGVPASRIVVLRREDRSGAVAVLRPVSLDAAAGIVVVETGTFSTFQAHVGAGPDAAGTTIAVDRPGGVTVGGAEAATATVTVRDAFGFPLAGVPVAFAAQGVGAWLAAPGTGAGAGTPAHPTRTAVVATDAAGIAAVALVSHRPGARTFTASVAATGGGSSISLARAVAFTPRPAARLEIQGAPRLLEADAITDAPVEVALLDATGAVAADAQTQVTLALAANPGGASLAGTTTISATAGIARFADLSVDAVGAGYTLVASAPGLALAASAPFVVTATAPLDAGLPRLAAARVVTVGADPFRGAAGDLDQDGHMDVVVANRGAGAVSVLFGDGRGGFERADHATGAAPWDVAIGDLDGDGRPDIAVACHDANTVALLLRDPAAPRGFLAAPSLSTGTRPASVAIADLDGDGRMDLAVAERGTNAVRVLLQDPAQAGTFRAPVTHVVGPAPVHIAVADIDVDGRPDLVVACSTGDAVALLLGDAQAQTPGGFRAAVTIPVGRFPTHVAVGDANGDGAPDIAVACSAALGGASDVRVILQDPSAPGVFLAASTVHLGGAPEGTAWGDIDEDGRTDLVVASTAADALLLLRQDPARTGAFLPPARVDAPSRPMPPLVLDIDHDGRLDVVAPLAATGEVVTALGDAQRPAAFATATALPAGTNPVHVALADLDGDGLMDALSCDQSGATLSVRAGDSARPGALQGPRTVATGAGPAYAAVEDLDGDGLPDVVVANELGRTLSVLLQDPAQRGVLLAASNFPASTYASGAPPRGVAVADLDLDGRPDVAVALEGAGVALHLQDPARPGAFFAPLAVTLGGDALRINAVDLDGDGAPDLVVTHFASGEAAILLNDRARPGRFLHSVTYAAGVGACGLEVADLDLDGALDVAVACRGAGTVALLRGRGDGTFAAAVTVPAGIEPWDVRAGDLDGDGLPDLAVARFGAGPDPGGVTILRNDRSRPGTFVPGPTYRAGPGPASLALGDLDGDGALDVVTADRAGGTLSVLRQRPHRTRTPGAASLAFTTEPADVTGRAVVAPAVEVRDASGARLPSARTRVTLSLEAAPGSSGGGGLSGSASTRASSGLAAFPDLSVLHPGTYVLVARAIGLVATSAPFTVAADPPLEAPSGLTATALPSGPVALAWTDRSSREAGYVVERRLRAEALPQGAVAQRCPSTGNHYAYIPEPMDAFQARAAAEAGRYRLYGRPGHLATVTSAAENEFVTGPVFVEAGHIALDNGYDYRDHRWSAGPERSLTLAETGFTAWQPQVNATGAPRLEGFVSYWYDRRWTRVAPVLMWPGVYVEFETHDLAEVDFTEVASLGPDAAAFIDASAAPFTAYEYRVAARAASGGRVVSGIAAALSTAPVFVRSVSVTASHLEALADGITEVTLEVAAFDAAGAPVASGTPLLLEATLGAFSGAPVTIVATVSGTAVATLTTAAVTGTATLSVRDVGTNLATLAAGDLRVAFVAAAPPLLTAPPAPSTLVSGGETPVLLRGEGLHAGTSVVSLAPGVTVTAVRHAHHGETLEVFVRVEAGAPTSAALLLLENDAGSETVALDVRDGARPLVVATGESVTLAGTVRLAALTVEAGGTLRGVGLRPLVLEVAGNVVVEGTIDVSGSPGGPTHWGPWWVPLTHVWFMGVECGGGGDGGPGAGGGGGGGINSVACARSSGGHGGAGFTGGGGGGGARGLASGRGGAGAGSFGRGVPSDPLGEFEGGPGGAAPRARGGAAGGGGGRAGGGGGTGDGRGTSGGGGDHFFTAASGAGGGAGGAISGRGGGGGGYATAGGAFSQGTLGGRPYGGPEIQDLLGGAGGGGGCQESHIDGKGGGGGGGGGAVAILAGGAIRVGAAGAILANGGAPSVGWTSVYNHHFAGEGGGGSGGAVVLSATTVGLDTGARVEARGSQGVYDGGAGGQGRIRVDALSLEVDGAPASHGTLGGMTAPAVGHFGAFGTYAGTYAPPP